MQPRIAIASLMQESNSFSPLPTTVETFESYYLLRGDEILSGYGEAKTEVPGFLDVLAAAGATPVPLLAAYAAASGTVTRAAFDALVGEMEERLRAAGPVDGLLLALHGALVVEDQPDGDGEIIQRMRAILPTDVPIGVSLDLHGHITPLMLQPGVFHIGYREYPHTDIYETGVRTARLLLDVVAGPAEHARDGPCQAAAPRQPDLHPHHRRPASPRRRGSAPDGGRGRGHPRGAVPGAAVDRRAGPRPPAASVCADNSDCARQAAEKLVEMIWQRRADFFPDLTPLDEAIRIGLASEGLTLVSDAGDAPTGGSAADSAAVLKALLACGADKSARLCDP